MPLPTLVTPKILADLLDSGTAAEPLLSLVPAAGGLLFGLLVKHSATVSQDAADEDLAASHQDERLRTFGQLAAGIAHEINTPAQFAGDNLRFLADAFADLQGFLDEARAVQAALERSDAGHGPAERLRRAAEAADLDYLVEEIPRAIAQAREGLERIARIVLAVKELSHPTGREKQPADINRLIESTVTVCRNEWKYVARLELDLDPGLPQPSCHAEEISQVVLNLVVNAAHAIEERFGAERGPQGLIRVSTSHPAQDVVEIRVADNGCGIPAEIRDQIWERFFTTKPKGRGTGQGLAIARSIIVERHGGELTFDSRPGEGTEFIVRLPVKVDTQE
ncbi:MAG: hypothetical protein Kow0062_05620 [Acidobacteriota bacterium]